MGASGMAWSARSEKSRFSAGGPVSYLSHYLLDFYITVSIFILHNLLLLDSISFLLDSKSTFIRRSRAKHFGYPPFFDHKSATKPLQSHNSYLSYEYNKTVVLLPVCGGRKNFGSRGFFSRSRLPNFADRDSEKKRVYAFFSESSRSANFASRAC